MKFRSPNEGQTVRVASTDGHIALVTREWRDLPPILHGEAFKLGCQCDQQVAQADLDASVAAGQNAVQTGGEKALIKAALKAMLLERVESPDKAVDYFTPDNIPQVDAVSRIAAITCDKADVLEVWAQLQEEANSLDVKKPKAKSSK